MNCRTCGTPLPSGAANCPQCGAATSFSTAATAVAPDDPTIASSSEAMAPPPNPYGSPAYDNPYASAPALRAPGPPLPTRSGKRSGLLVGALLLVVLLIGGGVLMWRMDASTSNAATASVTATATAQAHVSATTSAVAALQPFPANGSATTLKSTTTATRQEGSNKIVSQTQHGVITGDIMGSYTNEETLTLAADNSGTFSGTITCTCTVTGKSGTLIWSYTGMQAADGSFQGQAFDFHGTGDLARLHGQGVFQGQGDHLTYSCELHFDP
ncbi:MAG TPA: hypothetical protein VF026_32615 [Ktedonobacteraceae bacterium]